MSLSPSILDAMVAAGCTTEQVVAAVKAALNEADALKAAKRDGNAARQRRKREADKEMSRRVTDVTARDQRDASPIPDKEIPQTLLENNPYPKNPTPPNGGSPSQAETDAAIQAYSEMAALHGLAVPRVVTGSRRQRVAAVVRAHGLECWREALTKLGASDFCRGMNDRGWKADLDFLLQAKSFTRVLEGHYDNRGAIPPPGRPISLASAFGSMERLQQRDRDDQFDTASASNPIRYLPAASH